MRETVTLRGGPGPHLGCQYLAQSPGGEHLWKQLTEAVAGISSSGMLALQSRRPDTPSPGFHACGHRRHLPRMWVDTLQPRLVKIGGRARQRMDPSRLHLASDRAGGPLWHPSALVPVVGQ